MSTDTAPVPSLVPKVKEEAAEGGTEEGKPEFYVIVYNVAKRVNVGNMIRSATAFAVKEILVTNTKKMLQFHGSQVRTYSSRPGEGGSVWAS